MFLAVIVHCLWFCLKIIVFSFWISGVSMWCGIGLLFFILPNYLEAGKALSHHKAMETADDLKCEYVKYPTIQNSIGISLPAVHWWKIRLWTSGIHIGSSVFPVYNHSKDVFLLSLLCKKPLSSNLLLSSHLGRIYWSSAPPFFQVLKHR